MTSDTRWSPRVVAALVTTVCVGAAVWGVSTHDTSIELSITPCTAAPGATGATGATGAPGANGAPGATGATIFTGLLG